ncbi:MAG: lipid-A-disaccharide synthase [Candidatus Accumulibacter sp.]|jgi:lipid-A-disaccharide synthase|nr:lipid-A-disaccharide synthase [Accumulibacter sp.]
MPKTVKIALVVGEVSGDLLASHLIQALRSKLPKAVFYGIGGSKMCEQGFDAWFNMEKLAVLGYVEVIKHFREISGIRKELKRRLLADPPDIFIGVDAPDFNLALEKALKRAGIQTIHYVSPSVWAWRGGRVKKIGAAVSHLLTLFPFESAIYEKKGIPVSFVGHPLADMIPLEDGRRGARELFDIPSQKPVIALLPGSRCSELHSMANVFIETAREVKKLLPDVMFFVPLATRETRRIFETAVYKASAGDLPFHLLFGHAREAMAAADVVLATSGTVTLEAALLKRPMVVAYKIAPLTFRLLKRLYYLPYVALPNILAGKFIVPEFIQDDATPRNMAQALLNYFFDEASRERLFDSFREIHLKLRQNNSDKAAMAVIRTLQGENADAVPCDA